MPSSVKVDGTAFSIIQQETRKKHDLAHPRLPNVSATDQQLARAQAGLANLSLRDSSVSFEKFFFLCGFERSF